MLAHQGNGLKVSVSAEADYTLGVLCGVVSSHTRVSCKGNVGRYVTISSSLGLVLSLCEVEVFEQVSTDQPRPVSSLLDGGDSDIIKYAIGASARPSFVGTAPLTGAVELYVLWGNPEADCPAEFGNSGSTALVNGQPWVFGHNYTFEAFFVPNCENVRVSATSVSGTGVAATPPTAANDRTIDAFMEVPFDRWSVVDLTIRTSC
eukprot:SAG22_NODE_4425_length_1273_cov_1.122658_1_plen_204_part_10